MKYRLVIDGVTENLSVDQIADIVDDIGHVLDMMDVEYEDVRLEQVN